MSRFSQILAQMEVRMNSLSSQNRVDLEPAEFERMYDALETNPEISNDALLDLLSG